MFTLEDGSSKTVVQYYRVRYNVVLKNVAMPAIQSGSASKPVYLPMEFCTIVSGQRYSRKLNERQVTALLRATCQRPGDRERESIHQLVAHNNYDGDGLIKGNFGIQMRKEMTLVNARVLPPPSLKYHDSGREKFANPSMGQWNMTNKHFNVEPLVPFQSAHHGQMERVLRDIHRTSIKRLEEIGQKGRHLQLLIVILPDVSGTYGVVKRICETELGIVSQCCMPRQAAKLNKQYLENLTLKINVKVGGRNTILNDAVQGRNPFFTGDATIIFGADVTHPPPGEDSSLSIAAVVALMDWPEVTKYRGIVSAQAHR